jgi:hypothetical protein
VVRRAGATLLIAAHLRDVPRARPGRLSPRLARAPHPEDVDNYQLYDWGGYLRVEPREGDTPIVVRGKPYIRTAAPVTPRVRQADDGWKLSIRFDG